MMKLCTWNVRGLNAPGKMQLLERTIEKMAITGIAETHWKKSGHFQSEEGNLVIASGNPSEPKNGVAIVVNKAFRDTVLGYNAINDRVLTIKIRATPINLNVIQVYTPTSTSTEEEMNNFYGIFCDTIRDIP